MSSYISAEVGENGTWSLSIGGVRTEDYSGYFSFTDTDSLELTLRTMGNEVTESYVLADIAEDVVATEIDMEELNSGGGDSGEFERGLYGDIEGLDDLPLTAINRLTAVGLTVSVVLIVYGSYLLVSAYTGEKNERWEKNFLKRLDEE